MRNKREYRRGISSVLALIYLSLLAALAVGFYSAADVGTSLADNHQYINRSATSAESGLAFARYQMDHIILPGTTTSANALSATLTALQTNLNSSANMNGTNPNTVTYNGNSAIAIPGQPSGWNWSGSGALPSDTNWMTTDSSGGNVVVFITQPSSASFGLTVAAVGQNSNNASHSMTPITRSLQLGFGSTVGAGTTSANPIFSYGMVSYGEIVLNANVMVSGTNSGVLAIPKNNVTKPIQVNGTGSFGGDFYWANTIAENAITWGSLSVDGYLPASSQFVNHVHGGITAPTAPTYDTSVFSPYVTSQNPGAATTTLTNASLPTKVGGYTFNNPVTINGILYLQSGAKVTFNAGVTVNGAIVQANNAAAGQAVTFNSNVTQGAMPSGYAAGEESLTGTFLLLPNGAVTFNAPTTATGSVIANGMTINSNLSINGGAIVNLGTGNMTFNSGSTLTVNTATGTAPAGTSGTITPGNVSYTATVNSYQEIGQ